MTVPPGVPPRRGTARSGLSPQAFRVLAGSIVALLALGALSGVMVRGSHPSRSSVPGAIVAVPGASGKALPASDAELMGITSLGGRPARNFTLTDQAGATVSLSALDAHHAVVLTFFDDRCIDVCPIVADEITAADASLGAAAARVAFVAVNVNPLHTSVASVHAFTVEHGLGRLPNFYFLTGTVAALRTVWAAYGVTVEVAQPGQAILHTDAMYFLSQGGRLRYQATPFADERPNGTGYLPAPTLAQWGAGIARYARSALG